MAMSPLAHIQAQRRQLMKVAFYGIEAAVICFLGMWLLFEQYSLPGKLFVSAAFGLGVVVIGSIAVLVASASTAREIERQQDQK
jgi:hypothetical protein